MNIKEFITNGFACFSEASKGSYRSPSSEIEKMKAEFLNAPPRTYLKKENIWVDAEFYLYGKITDAGGKDKANIHIATEEFGPLRIQTPIDFLERYESNILYRTMGIYATGKQHLHTGEIDTSSLRFVSLVDYHPQYDEGYLNGLREKAQKSWLSSINADDWINRIRGRV
jgi:hypothetical protein